MKTSLKQGPALSKLPSAPIGKANWPWTPEILNRPDMMPDGAPWPKISVVTPSYNQGQFIEETIRSVLLQDYPNLEFIIIDGGSTDNSVEIIKKYEPWLAYWISEPDQGQSSAINKGVHLSSGDILFWLNSDDICLPDAFGPVAQAFHANPAVRLVIGQARLIDSEGQVIGELQSHFSSWDELVTNPMNSVRQISTFFSRALFDELGYVDESLHIAMDTELLMRFTRYHTPLVVDRYFSAYRVHSRAKTYKQLIKGYEESAKMRKRYFINKRQAAIYRARNSANWLDLSEFERLGFLEKIKCMWRAIQNRPSIVISRSFWYSIKKQLSYMWRVHL